MLVSKELWAFTAWQFWETLTSNLTPEDKITAKIWGKFLDQGFNLDLENHDFVNSLEKYKNPFSEGNQGQFFTHFWWVFSPHRKDFAMNANRLYEENFYEHSQ